MEKLSFSDKLTKKKAIGLIHRVYITQMANSQKHTASTLTKSEVRGGGRKPRPQKGQGYARSGSIRSPLWAGGGVIFGPKPYVVHKKINKKEKRLAILSAFYLKEKECTFLENEFLNSFKDYKTKTMIEFLIFNKINIKEDKVLLSRLFAEEIAICGFSAKTKSCKDSDGHHNTWGEDKSPLLINSAIC
jgi:large subunit ribosomal protein L4